MIRWIKKHPELAGLLIGLVDLPLRLIAAAVWSSSDGRIYGPVLLGNVHHPVETRAFGLDSLQWFWIAAVMLTLFYAGVWLCTRVSGRDYGGYRFARFSLAAMAGVLVLNLSEALLTGKVTDYFGLINGSRAHVINLGDVVVTLSAIATAPAIFVGWWSYLRDPERAR
jgi:hypothetical protein